ncbi:Putative zinc finger protein [Sarcoptes scabiei]|uniref:Putative zinc finger protein n=1 Tax=Sarcoptes scabiei TaxID=52283 RepID=A0A834RH97_SARSC|nr:Putative zinc finger protein [Sarcoptes scabiei]
MSNHQTLALSGKKPHLCPQCQKSFSSTHQLAQHNRIHSGEKPYGCSFCERKFKQLSHLQQHTRLHTGERPYKCDCGRSFIQLSNLQQHMKTHISEPINSKSEKNFFCVHCGKGFKGQTSLYLHQSKNDQTTSTSQLIYTCHICNSVFVDEASYKKHLDSHQSQQTIQYQQHPQQNHHLRKSNQLQDANASSSSATVAVTLWPCTACTAVFANEISLLNHFEQMKFDSKHQKAQFLHLQRPASSMNQNQNHAKSTSKNNSNSQPQIVQNIYVNQFSLISNANEVAIPNNGVGSRASSNIGQIVPATFVVPVSASSTNLAKTALIQAPQTFIQSSANILAQNLLLNNSQNSSKSKLSNKTNSKASNRTQNSIKFLSISDPSSNLNNNLIANNNNADYQSNLVDSYKFVYS